MKTGLDVRVGRSVLVAAIGVLAVALTGCTGRGGGQLPADGLVFKGQASFGFSFSCQDSGGINPPTGALKLELSYTDHGSNPIGSSFSIHGIADEIDPVLESEICIGKNPPPGGNELIFLGRYYLTSSAPAGFRTPCAAKTAAAATCRFEVVVRDNDKNRAPSAGDYFHLTLSGDTALSSQLDAATVFYTRGGTLSSGNLTVN